MREMTLHLPEEIAEMITQAAISRSQSPDSIVAEALQFSLQPPAQQAVQYLNREIEKLHNKTTEELETLLNSDLFDDEQERLSELLQFNRERQLLPSEQQELQQFHRKIEASSTRKAAVIWLLTQRKKQAVPQL